MMKSEAPPQRETNTLAISTDSAVAGGLAVDSPSTKRASKLQAMANESPKVRHQSALPASAQQGAGAVAQRVRAEHIELSPRIAAQRQQLEGMRRGGYQSSTPNQTGLPDDLKHGIEMLSGISLDNVRVHYNSTLPIQRSALAYAQGRHIHLAPGQERHLPHEAWHVVQQAQGRVQPTMQLACGEQVNDDASLELEADTMAARALRLSGATPMDAVTYNTCGGPLADVAAPPIQRLATQVTLGDGNTLVVRIVGRPENVYGASSGDHLTAFSARQTAVVREMGGQNVWRALGELDMLISGLEDLPGYKLIKSMVLDQEGTTKARNERWIEARDRLRTSRETLPSPAALQNIDTNTPMTAHELSQLQELISSYFEVVELTPLSTINIAAKSQGTAGKGKGESSHLKRLREAEENFIALRPSASSPPLGKTVSAGGGTSDATAADAAEYEALAAALSGLFDLGAAAHVATEIDEVTLAQMGVPFFATSTVADRVTLMISHHLTTMTQSFPRVMARLGDWGPLRKRLADIALPHLQAQWTSTLALLGKDIAAAGERIVNKQNDIKLLHGSATKKKQELNDEIIKDNAEITRKETQRIQIVDKRSGYGPTAPQPVIPLLPVSAAPRTALATSTGDSRKARVHRAEPKVARVKPGEAGQAADDQQSEDLDNEEAATVNEGNEVVVGPAVQIHVNKADQIIKIDFSGRSPSPLMSGKMGAHTTAWIVYQDVIRSALVGQSLTNAASIVDTLWIKINKISDKMYVFDDTDFGEHNREKASSYIAPRLKKMDKLGTGATLSILQNLLREMLNFQNNIPGATLDATNTDGHGEAHHRERLLHKQSGGKLSETDVEAATAGLLDLRALGAATKVDDNLREAATQHHQELINLAYLNQQSHTVPSYITPAPRTKRRRVEASDISIDASVASSSNSDIASPLSTSTFSSSMLGAQDASLALAGATASRTHAPLDVNDGYLYEDAEMYGILMEEVAGLANVHVVPPTLMQAGALRSAILDARVPPPAIDQSITLLVPLNIGNYHWVGVMIVVTQRAPTIVRYLDPLLGGRNIAPEILNEIRECYPNAQLENAHRILQIDGTSCGPLTIENLVRQLHSNGPRSNVRADRDYTRRLRNRHVEMMDRRLPGFRERQRQGNVRRSTFDMSSYLNSGFSFDKRDSARILRIAQDARDLPPALREPIVKAFELIVAQNSDTREAKTDYETLRGGFKAAIGTADGGNLAFRKFMRDVWKTEDPDPINWRPGNYDEMLAIATHTVGSDDLGAQIDRLAKSIREDEALNKLMSERTIKIAGEEDRGLRPALVSDSKKGAPGLDDLALIPQTPG